jgi:hypothetical protein
MAGEGAHCLCWLGIVYDHPGFKRPMGIEGEFAEVVLTHM